MMKALSRWTTGASILMYHSIADGSDEPFTVSIDNFKKQISWLCNNGFEIISLDLLLELIKQQDYRGLQKKVVITFDDGFKDFVTNALPILLEHNATATIFLVIGLLGKSAAWNGKAPGVEQLMSEDEARYIKENGMSLGSHTVTHLNLKQADVYEAKKQLEESCEALRYLGETFCSLAYPWGQWSDRVADIAKDVGYDCAVAVGESTSINMDDIFQLPRISMTKDIDLTSFQKLLGRTRIEKELRRKVWQFRQRRLANSEEGLSS